MPYGTAKSAGVAWVADYDSLLMSFDKAEVRATLLAFCTTEENLTGKTEDEIYLILCIAFCKLYQRGAIAPIRPLSSEGERQLQEILANFNVVSSEPDVDEAQAEHLSLRQQAIRDSHTLPSVEFNQKLRKDPKYRAAYEKAGGLAPDESNL